MVKERMDLLPTSRSSIGYYYHGTNYVVHPDASFTLDQRDGVGRARDRQLLLRRQRRDVIRVCETCQGFARSCKRCRGFHLVYEGQGGEYLMPPWVSESWLKEHGCAGEKF